MMLQGLELFRLEMDSMRERFNVEMKKMETVNWATEGVQDGQRSRSPFGPLWAGRNGNRRWRRRSFPLFRGIFF